MKNKVLIITCLFFFQFSLYAQQEELQKTISKLDIIIQKESQYFATGSHYYGYFDGHYGEKGYIENPFNRKYEKEVLDYLEPYITDTLYNLRIISTSFIYSLGITSKNVEIRQRAVNDILSMAVIISDVQWDLTGFNQEDYDKKAKERIKQLIRGEKTQQEIDIWFEYQKRSIITKKWFKDEVDKIKKTKSLTENYIIDSLLNIYIETDHFIKGLSISNNKFYQLPGWLYMYDFKKELKVMLKNPLYNPYYFYIKLSLARMGEIEYEKEILKNDQNWQWVSFINTQSAYSWLVNYMNRTNEMIRCDNDEPDEAPLYQLIYVQLSSRYILNFPNEYKVTCKLNWQYCGFNNVELEKFEQGKIWLEKNKGKYKLDKSTW